ncbi:MAG: Na+/H+ antiporter subunit E [Clostridiaceae bacterium]|nr:Na+/H+ antiporter subunit E [Clostridiaceae bacterium]
MFVVFLLLWILLNGRVTMEIVILGAIFSAAFDLFARKYLGRTLKGDLKWLRRAPLLAKYLIVLLFEIVKANRDVIRLVLSPSQEVEPRLVEVRTDLKSDSARSMLANSITLTPGTITVKLKSGYLQVHCLDRSLSEGLGDSSFVRILREMEAIE